MRRKISVTAFIICMAMCVCLLCACADKVKIIADDNPYTFVTKVTIFPK